MRSSTRGTKSGRPGSYEGWLDALHGLGRKRLTAIRVDPRRTNLAVPWVESEDGGFDEVVGRRGVRSPPGMRDLSVFASSCSSNHCKAMGHI